MRRFSAGTWQASNWGEDIADCITVYLPGETEHDYEIRTLEDLEKIPDAPEELREFVRGEVESRALAENEVVNSFGEVTQLAWVDGVPCWKKSRDWATWNWHRSESLPDGNWQLTAQAYFRAHCPIDRFVTDEGEVLEFRMRDDGEAEAISDDFKRDQTAAEQTLDSENWSDAHCALLRFRDHERGKWTHEWNDCRPGWIDVKNDGRDFAAYPFISSSREQGEPRWSERALALVPLWKRREVEALYREKNPEWTAEQLKKREGEKVVFEGTRKAPEDARCFFAFEVDEETSAKLQMGQRYRVTAEPIPK